MDADYVVAPFIVLLLAAVFWAAIVIGLAVLVAAAALLGLLLLPGFIYGIVQVVRGDDLDRWEAEGGALEAQGVTPDSVSNRSPHLAGSPSGTGGDPAISASSRVLTGRPADGGEIESQGVTSSRVPAGPRLQASSPSVKSREGIEPS